VETFRETLDTLGERPRVLVIRMRDVPMLDSTAVRALRAVVRRSRSAGTEVVLADVQAQPHAVLDASGALAEIGLANMALDIDDALARAYELTAGGGRYGQSRAI
jgi:SulP family sulfate permease